MSDEDRKELAGGYALIKFYRKEEHLEALLDGTLHCRTPEHYRISAQAGVGDRYESGTFLLRPGNGLEDWELYIDKRLISDVTELRWRNPGAEDHFIHCWTLFRMPKTGEELAQLARDLERLRLEFGPHYAVIPSHHIQETFERVRKVQPDADLREVRYEVNAKEWTATCKDARYSYQREARFLMGKCPEKDTFQNFVISGGLRDLIQKNPEIKMVSRKSGEAIFTMSTSGIFAGPQKAS